MVVWAPEELQSSWAFQSFLPAQGKLKGDLLRGDGQEHSPNAVPSTMDKDEWKGELKRRMRARVYETSVSERDLSVRQQKSTEAQYYNPDAWSRLIGKSNTSPIYINGELITSLLDTGSQISFISEKFCTEKGYDIQPIEKLINFKGANGLDIEYSGFIEVNLQIPGKSFNHDILLLVVPHILYHNYVPVTLGTLALEMVDAHLIDTGELKLSDKEWRLVHQVIDFRKGLQSTGPLGLVRLTKSVQISSGQVSSVSGITKIKKGGYSMHAVAEASTKATLPEGVSLVEEQYVNLEHGSSRVGLLLKNDTPHSVTIPAKAVVCQLTLGNLVPKLVAPQPDAPGIEKEPGDPDIDQDIPYVEWRQINPMKTNTGFDNFNPGQGAMGAQAGASDAAGSPHRQGAAGSSEATGSSTDCSPDQHWIFNKVDLAGTHDWPEMIQ